ncbi:hypothetical protein BDV30DRAFT_213211 [Aspergillus minisclerotigenes]|uniref:DNA2/NAM7 helicase helicase domain-containing protein n=1 Tax=Aspergillus minisclerotigenes TaxID=656917 RepID=A0A5N6J0L5_9EURO|nr:hypothetical protein BDV30DRAFT_213211 [Aspergillus minisclerotigenes]
MSGFNQEQKIAFGSLRHLRGGFAFIHGPPDTGKMYWLLRTLTIFLYHPNSETGKRHQVLSTALSNNVVDSAA